ncbi:hypothetical protein Pint_20685 [Pistacia integerrima]|uniref:Uncharacterized protein n=1 Tax=Pistacia integerrima TaxID=434235 RepID=A0ACC0XFG5_9ROSI|nr:hypothetical protein Pint_20685 [Pistacia integerrima]
MYLIYGVDLAAISYASESATRFMIRLMNLHTMLFQSDELCHKICNLLATHDNLKSTSHTSVEELVGSFLHILAQNQKIRLIKCQMRRSTKMVSRNFHLVLNIVLRLHSLLFKKPKPIPENSTDERWKWFKRYLGALDGAYIKVHVPTDDKFRYWSRKNKIATNVLGVCTPNMQFIYVLPRWEGSIADDRVLRDAITRRNGLKVPQGQYYLCDDGYTNGERFLAPYRGQRYHLSEWSELPIDSVEEEL